MIPESFEWLSVNLNDIIKVRLGPQAVDTWHRYWDGILKSAPNCTKPELKIDADGRTSIQLWQFASIFGSGFESLPDCRYVEMDILIQHRHPK